MKVNDILGDELAKAFTKFGGDMLRRLAEKKLQGFEGWDHVLDEEFNIKRRLQEKVTSAMLGEADEKDMVDIANFAMMICYCNTNQEEEK